MEIDLLRSIAILGMVIYHTAYDLENFYGWPVLRSLGVGGWLLARSVACLFLLLVGISFVISRERTKIVGQGYPCPTILRLFSKYFKRGLSILACGLLVSLATYLFDPETYVRFGILHLIGVAIILLPFCTKFRRLAYLPGIILIGFGPWIERITMKTSLFLPLGITPPSFDSIDYFPLIPWFGVILIGMSLGYTFYIDHTEWRKHIFNYQLSMINFPGRHALAIYLLHQPIILGILWIFFHKAI